MNTPVTTVMCLIQMLGVFGAVILAVVEVETIMITGPVLSALGLVLAYTSVSAGSRFGVFFGGSTPVTGLFLFLLINFM